MARNSYVVYICSGKHAGLQSVFGKRKYLGGRTNVLV